LAGATADGIAAEIVAHGDRWRLADNAPARAVRPLLIVTAVRDSPASKATGLKAALAAVKPAQADYVELDTDHGFNDHRIALETAIIEWLAKLPGAPSDAAR
jgi:alpha/beta superfamily hydrolase